MAHPRPFRFGVQLSTAPDAATWARMAIQAEDLGFSTLFMPDHFGDQLSPTVALQAAADATTTLRVGTLVFDNDYRHPVVLAKDCATLDVLSGGRLELGLGAGWMTSDYTQSGIPMDPPKVRVDRMVESVAVLKGVFGPDAFSYEGEHYTLAGYDGFPKPVQQPHPPLLIGGGLKRVLSFAAREAQIVGVNPTIPNGRVDAEAALNGTAEETDQKLEWIRAAAGDRFDDIELNALHFATIVTDDRAGTIEMMAPLFGIEPAAVAEYPHALIGTVDEICADLEARRERWGFSYVVVQGDSMEPFAPVVARLAGQ
ncbi:TIGR03621 family F420-dependent LLM class oxidoreductase [Iamia sp. SCSIO 61187]|uniref:TIGR03621 family F420-dependent LLM class oxidoreductase n=1 Tax=Iamia sp. SCSIO 61187 TaxID=2722752 RepID=UPI001C62E035|nr:TIGR03621 family F420-dependent LLM class oxidoreductase [Iamia sp. SCSIO 61187]QYG93573.1 TIGR03621 family F420-dependent LLM class oxidoreductase [Iamia sp. SCSIO 61187]